LVSQLASERYFPHQNSVYFLPPQPNALAIIAYYSSLTNDRELVYYIPQCIQSINIRDILVYDMHTGLGRKNYNLFLELCRSSRRSAIFSINFEEKGNVLHTTN
jgi:hypothetical protein